MMIDLSRRATSKSITYYTVLKSLSIATDQLGIRPQSLGDTIYLIEFCIGELADPNSEAIGIFGDGAGNRQYQWQDYFWYELDMTLLQALKGPIANTVLEFTEHGSDATSVQVLLYRIKE